MGAHFPISNNPSGINATKDIPKEILLAVNQFQSKQQKGFIDVWWLYDDGGLTLLLPYLLSTRKQWKGCKLRVFALANKKDELDTEQRNMAALLSKFRIDFSDVIVISDIVKPPKESTKKEFKELIAKWMTKDDEINNCENNENDNQFDGTDRYLITDSELFALKDKVLISNNHSFIKIYITCSQNNRHMRLRELLCQYSKEASLIVM